MTKERMACQSRQLCSISKSRLRNSEECTSLRYMTQPEGVLPIQHVSSAEVTCVNSWLAQGVVVTCRDGDRCSPWSWTGSGVPWVLGEAALRLVVLVHSAFDAEIWGNNKWGSYILDKIGTCLVVVNELRQQSGLRFVQDPNRDPIWGCFDE